MEREMEAELQFHLAAYADDLVRSGIARSEAERRARLEFGSSEPVKEDCRQAVGLRLLDETAQDVRYAARMLRKSPGFALVAVFTLALGIGGNTAIFSLMNAWVIRPVPYPNPDQLLAIWGMDIKRGTRATSAAGDVYDWRQNKDVFETICGWSNASFTLMHGAEPQQRLGSRVNAEFFPMLGVTPQLGRNFLDEEDQPGAPPVAILSDGLWRDVFAADTGIIGKTIAIDGKQTTVVGILPASFHLPLMGRASLWMPLALSDSARADRSARYLNVMARLRPGVQRSQAAEYLKAFARRSEKAYPETNTDRGVTMNTLPDEVAQHAGKEPIIYVFAMLACVLLMACANVANLIVGRALRRQQEMAVRLAIGAGKLRLLRQLLAENLMLFLLAAGLSVAFAIWGVDWMQNAVSEQNRAFLPNHGVLHYDVATLLYTLGIAIFTGLLFGFAPAVHCWRADLNHSLRGASSRISAGGRLKNVIVVFEMALALLVVVASGLLVKGLGRMYATNPGFHLKGLLTADIVLSDSKYADLNRAQAFFDAVLNQIRPLAGVKSIAAAQFVPFEGSYRTIGYAIEGQAPSAPRTSAIIDAIAPDYFGTLGIPVVRGRTFTEQDRAKSDPVVVINQTMERLHWPNQDPVGQRIRIGAKLATVATIIGVVQDVDGQNETDVQRPEIYQSINQFPSRALTLVVRSEGGISPTELTGALRRATAAVDPGQAVYNVRTMEGLQSDLLNPRLVGSQLMSVFGGVSLFLAAMGIYSVMAYTVAARKKEFGIRMALGAGKRELLVMVAGQGMKLAAIGFAIGLGAALATTRFMRMILYHVSPTDFSTFLLTILLMLGVAAVACYLPARQASSVDPMRALHHD